MFEDRDKINAIYHLNQLEEFMKLKGVPESLQLAIAFKSISDPVAKQWMSAVSHTLNYYEQFKVAFTKTFWSKMTQSRVKCSIYQDKYEKQSNLSMSGHLIEYAVLASYLGMSDAEFIDAIKLHYPVNIQRCLVGSLGYRAGNHRRFEAP
ncbi:hypothetical protein L798_13016 [Zootermopsis nevadensis]|uniref:Uncharacterized protein n=1 Tax=Zootermopsis nevadensis TaxID=136037 RepID=A0A067QVN0_ZOONE|nr:hypothetical protein L798_13016 [Zootermopsis nevadensis]